MREILHHLLKEGYDEFILHCNFFGIFKPNIAIIQSHFGIHKMIGKEGVRWKRCERAATSDFC
jgi:hypothetical protein